MKLTSGFYHDSVWLVIGVDFLFARPKVHCVGGTLESSWPVEVKKQSSRGKVARLGRISRNGCIGL